MPPPFIFKYINIFKEIALSHQIVLQNSPFFSFLYS